MEYQINNTPTEIKLFIEKFTGRVIHFYKRTEATVYAYVV